MYKDIPRYSTELGMSPDYVSNSFVNTNLARADSRIWIGTNVVYKVLKDSEIRVYEILQSHQEVLNNIGIIFPNIYGNISTQELTELGFQGNRVDRDIYILERLKILPVDLLKFFGVGIDYDQSDYQFLFEVFDNLRNEVSPTELEGLENYGNQIGYMQSNLYKIADNSRLDHQLALRNAQLAHHHLVNLEKQAAHRDINFGNFVILESAEGKKQLQIIDFETFGLEVPGYDEGRLLIHLSLNAENRNRYIDAYETFSKQRFTREKEIARMLGFWFTAIIRGYAELAYFKDGFYDQRLEYSFEHEACEYKHHICLNIEDVVNLGLEKMNDIFQDEI